MIAATKDGTITSVTVKEHQALVLRVYIFYFSFSRFRTADTKRNTTCIGSWSKKKKKA